VREPQRTAPHGGILDINERADLAVTRIICRRHSTVAAEELEPVIDLDGRQILRQGPASDSLEMGKTPARHILEYVKKCLGTHDTPLSSPWSDAGECIVYRVLKFEQRVLNIESLALRMFGMLIAQGGCKNRVLLKLMSSPSGVHGTPSRQQRYSVNTADGVPRLLPYEPSVP